MPAPPSLSRTVWRAYLVVAAVLSPVALWDDRPVPRLTGLALQGAAAVATGVGVHRNRPPARRAWLLLWGALTLVFAQNAIWAGQDLLRLPPPSNELFVNWLSYTAFGLGTAGLFLLAGRGGGRPPWESLIDAGIVTVGIAIPVWSFLVEPQVTALGLGSGELATRLIFPVCDLVIVAMTTRLWFTGARPPAAALLTVAQFFLLAADILFWSHADGLSGADFDRPADAAWLAWFTLCAAATLHPSMRDLGANIEAARSRSGTRARLLLLLMLSLVAPIVTALESGATTIGRRLVVPVFAGTLAVLLVVRMQLINRLARHRADELAYRATHDPLTGLGNRALLADRLRARPDGTLLLLDLDGFKLVNDTYGHPVGDRLLIAVAERLRSAVEPEDVLVRLGGDEFAVMTTFAATVPSKILHVLREPYVQDGRELVVTPSIGLLPLRGSPDPLRDADLALYAAKAAGRNQIVAFEPGLRDATRRSDALRRAFAAGELRVEYTRIDFEPGLFAARIDWPPHDGAALLAAAESAGLVRAIGAWLLDRACADAAAGGFSVAVPLSVTALRDPQLSGTVLATLARHDLPPRALTLVPQGTAALERLRAAGVRVGLATAWHPAGNGARNAR
ncbi:diguanylate cyclase [Dactylosporangium vinaceum]|uniref:Diguanylate cyclase domain-containing protein n=1 Tax=Dactylosporangium vinaceum TaxID=53362 RepID=A0ABV5M198_9ACTN|nr:diguanylate cyclase [Dactylosporangium vinaceum]UAB95462.1 diguanylate cyclase [Dactylosporangium vinaceum]